MNAQSPHVSAELLALPPAKTLVLTPSDRARRAFAALWADAALRAAGKAAVMLPTFDTLNGYAARLWSEAQLFGVNKDPRTLIAPVVEQALWRHFAQELTGATSAESAVLAAGLAEAWQLEHLHVAPAESPSMNRISPSSNGELYREARRRFASALQRQQAITAAELLINLNACEWVEWMVPYKHIITTPSFIRRSAEEAFLSRLASYASKPHFNMGYKDNVNTANADIVSVSRHQFSTELEERRAAIAWATQRLQRHVSAKHPQRIAIVVPELQRERSAWERALRAARLDYNLSLGLPVSKHPWAAAGFTLVGALVSSVPVEIVSAALRHARWGRTGDSLRAISYRERELLERGVSRCTLDEFCSEQVAALRSIRDRISQALGAFSLRRERLSRGQWSSVFEKLIDALSERESALDSGTFQLRASLLESIENWIELDDWLPAVTLVQAQQELIEIADQSAFQPEGSDAPLQVMGLLEAAGVPFDAMWFCGSSDRVLPERQRANPFLSTYWQRSARAGLADGDECEARAARLLHGWQGLCADIRTSIPLERAGEPQQWSPLWRDFHLREFDAVNHLPEVRAVVEIERVNDEKAPRWLLREDESRGTRTFEAQALCPRRGFAEGRLRLKPWPTPQSGLSPLQRGELVHAVAQRLGEALKRTHNDFDRMRAGIAGWIHESIEESRRELPQIPAVVWTSESVRLQKVFASVIEIEARRNPFRVLDIEKTIHSEIGGLRLSMRIDRLDALSQSDGDGDGDANQSAYAVIDFKSGNVQRAQLYDERLTLPQLPLYAQALGMDNVAAVAFAKVGDDEQGFTSLGSEASGFAASRNTRNPPPEWATLKLQWQRQLEELANELLSGEASIAPASGEITCRTCDFDRFCLVDRRALRALANDSDDVVEGDVQ